MELQQPQKEERPSAQIYALLAALALSALLASGCSTPPVSGNSVDEPITSSYNTCVRVMTAQGTAYRCNDVTTSNVTSYSRYNYTKTALTSKVGATEMDAAYAAYLAALPPEDLAAMNAQWEALAASN